MKITIIHGQNHKGSSYNIGKMLAEKITNSSNITEFFLPKDLNHFCLGCYSCIDDETKCPFWSEKSIIINAIKQADLIIYTTPTYCMGPSASLKAFLDLTFDMWMVHRPKSWMFNKKAVIISTAAGAGTKQAINLVKTNIANWGISSISSYGIAVQASSWENITNKKKIKIIKDITKLAKKIIKNKQTKVSIKTKFLFNLFGLLHKKGLDSSPVEKLYWEQNGWLKQNRPWKT